MYYSKQSMYISLEHPNGVLLDFYKFLAMSLEKEVKDVQQIPKNFTGNRMASQALNVNGNTIIQFTNLANGNTQFPQDEHGLVCFIRIYTGVDPALTNTVWQPGIVDPQLINGKFNLDLNGLILLRDIDMSYFTRSVEEPYSGYLQLVSPFLWAAQTNMTITLNLALAVVVANTNMKIEISGPGLIS